MGRISADSCFFHLLYFLCQIIHIAEWYTISRPHRRTDYLRIVHIYTVLTHYNPRHSCALCCPYNGSQISRILDLIQCKFIRPKRRIYQTNNAYSALVRQAKLEKEVRAIAEKNGKTGKRAARRKA